MNTEVEDKTFSAVDFTKEKFLTGTYENCIFNSCLFSNSDLSGTTFSDCKFESCDLSMIKLKKASFKGAEFTSCKMLGVRFDDCNPFLLSFEFTMCILTLSSFYGLKLKNIRFNECKLQEADFTDADLTSSVFKACDLTRAIFSNTILEGADFRTAENYSIDPENNRINKARFKLEGVVGLLDKYNIRIE